LLYNFHSSFLYRFFFRPLKSDILLAHFPKKGFSLYPGTPTTSPSPPNQRGLLAYLHNAFLINFVNSSFHLHYIFRQYSNYIIYHLGIYTIPISYQLSLLFHPLPVPRVYFFKFLMGTFVWFFILIFGFGSSMVNWGSLDCLSLFCLV
jgi:hypothetical protein